MAKSQREQLFDAYPDRVATVLALADQVLKCDPEDGPVLMRVGAVLAVLGRHDEAEAYLKRALDAAPANWHHLVLSHLGDLHKSKGDFNTALQYYQDASKLLPDDSVYHIYRGAALARLGRLKDAEAAHRKATECNEGLIEEAYCNLGLVLRAQGRFLEARNCFKKAIGIDPGYAEAKDALEDVSSALRIAARKRTEPSHATEPATGPLSNGGALPPAR